MKPLATRAPIPSPADRGPSDGEASTPPDWPKGGGGGFSRAKGADAMLPVCLTPHLGTPTPTDWPPNFPTPTPDWRATHWPPGLTPSVPLPYRLDGQMPPHRPQRVRCTGPLPHFPPSVPLPHRLATKGGLQRFRPTSVWGKGQSDPPLVQLLRKNSACKFCTHKISMGAKKPHPTLPFAPTRPLT